MSVFFLLLFYYLSQQALKIDILTSIASSTQTVCPSPFNVDSNKYTKPKFNE